MKIGKYYCQLANDGSTIGPNNHLIILGLDAQIQLLLAKGKNGKKSQLIILSGV
jgi:hypothetical protein